MTDKKTNPPELLAPAGGWDSLVAAVDAGADAVYLGMGKHNARAGAHNFDAQSVRTAIDHCHDSGVRVYAALNTLLLDKELAEALDAAAWLRHCGADALIVQDLGFAALLREQFPDLPLHASTQMSVHTVDGARFAGNAGCARVVLARECSLADIRSIDQGLRAIGSSVALEVFVHGAMCVSLSGQCLHSSFIGRRSGNRGLCAQPCRMEYRMNEDDRETARGRLLSMKDLALIDRLDALREAGAVSFKIEGRMKPPAYVARVVRAYRDMIDNYDPETARSLRDALEQEIGRAGGFTHGYGEKEDLIYTHDPSYRGWGAAPTTKCERKRGVHAVFAAHEGDPARLTLALDENPTMHATAIGATPEKALRGSLSADKLHTQLGKLGDTPFVLNGCDIDVGAGLYLSAAAINALRRDAVGALRETIVRSAHRAWQAPAPMNAQPLRRTNVNKPLIVAQVCTIDQARAAISDADAIVAQPRVWNASELAAWSAFARDAARPITLSLPPVLMPSAWDRVQALLESADCAPFSGALCGNVGQIAFLQTRFSRVHGDYTLNVCNGTAFEALRSRGLDRITLSVELNAAQIRDIARVHSGAEMIVSGRIAGMNLVHCPVWRAQKRCGNCETPRSLIDRTGMAFELRPYHVEKCENASGNRNDRVCTWQLYGGQALDLARYADALRKCPVDAWRLLFTRETPEAVREAVSRYRRVREGENPAPLPEGVGGHFRRGF